MIMKDGTIDLRGLTMAEAAFIWHHMNGAVGPQEAFEGRYGYQQLTNIRTLTPGGTYEMWRRIHGMLRFQGFNPEEYIPEQPLEIAGHHVRFTDEGIKVGCTDVSREQVAEIAKRLGLLA